MLTQLIGIPTNTSLKQLTKKVYANACVIPSTHSVSTHSHLGLIMPPAKYLIFSGVAFQLPEHPGLALVHAAAATQFQIAEANHMYDTTLLELSPVTTICKELKKQVLKAVNCLYQEALDNDTFGFANVTVITMLTHLFTHYGPITCANLEFNCASISTIWTPDNPIGGGLWWGCGGGVAWE
jgi:hypothetical protein